jgi:hypothetical protein
METLSKAFVKRESSLGVLNGHNIIQSFLEIFADQYFLRACHHSQFFGDNLSPKNF